jgi:hypothetical protein
VLLLVVVGAEVVVGCAAVVGGAVVLAGAEVVGATVVEGPLVVVLLTTVTTVVVFEFRLTTIRLMTRATMISAKTAISGISHRGRSGRSSGGREEVARIACESCDDSVAGGYHFPSGASCQPSPCGVSLISPSVSR